MRQATDLIGGHKAWEAAALAVTAVPGVDRVGRARAPCWVMTGVRLTRNRALDYGRVVRCACPGARRSFRAA